jgi:hypothetical protein
MSQEASSKRTNTDNSDNSRNNNGTPRAVAGTNAQAKDKSSSNDS